MASKPKKIKVKLPRKLAKLWLDGWGPGIASQQTWEDAEIHVRKVVRKALENDE